MVHHIPRITIILALMGFVLIFSSSHNALSSLLSPRDNPEFWDKFSGIIVIDPTWSSVLPTHSPVLPRDFPSLLSILGEVPLGPNVLCNQDQTTQAQKKSSIAVNPFNPSHIIATSNDYRLREDPPPENDVRAGYYVSFDGGNIW